MKKIGVSKIIDFRRIKNKGPQITFVKNLKKTKSENISGGGDYWITSTSACAATFWNGNKEFLDKKIEELKEKIILIDDKKTKNQFQINIDILFSMQDYDFNGIHPPADLNKLKLHGNIIQINDLPIQVRPQHIFGYEIDENLHIGGVWFVAKKGGYTEGELGIFTSALYQYFVKRYGDKYTIDPNYCVAIDISSVKDVRYNQILGGEIPNLLKPSIENLKKLL